MARVTKKTFKKPFKENEAAGVPGGPQVAVDPDKKPGIVDPNLFELAQFTIAVDSELVGGAAPGRNGYDPKRHRYNPDFINPPRYQITLDAMIGILFAREKLDPDLAKATSGLDNAEGSAIPTNTVLDQGSGANGQDDSVPGGGALSPIFDMIHHYRWVIDDLDSDFSNSQIVQPPISPITVAVFDVPRPGRYRVHCEVGLKDGRIAQNKREFELREWFFALIGDSFASGEGNPDLIGSVSRPLGSNFCDATTLAVFFNKIISGAKPPMSRGATWLEPKAHRSLRSGPARAALALQNTSGATMVARKTTPQPIRLDKVVFASFARSGAKVHKGLLEPQHDEESDFVGAGQIEELRRTAAGRRIDALMISIGGNDAGFAGVLEDLLKNDSVFRANLKFLGSGNDKEARDEIKRRLRELLGVGLPPGQQGELGDSYDALHSRVQALQKNPGVGHVYISGYPIGLFSMPDGGRRSCEIFAGPDLDLTGADIDMIHEHGALLNDLIKRKAEKFGWIFVPMADLFEGHGYCSPQSWWVKAETSCKLQGDFEGTMHPDATGHKACGERMAQALRKHTMGK